MACIKIQTQNQIKIAKIEVANTQSPVCFETIICVFRTLCILVMRGSEALPSICNCKGYNFTIYKKKNIQNMQLAIYILAKKSEKQY